VLFGPASCALRAAAERRRRKVSCSMSIETSTPFKKVQSPFIVSGTCNSGVGSSWALSWSGRGFTVSDAALRPKAAQMISTISPDFGLSFELDRVHVA
jgi:hypothetical protein